VLQQINEFLDCSFGRNPIKKAVNIDGELQSVDINEYNHSGAAKALELMGKHVNIQAYKEKQEINSSLTTTVDSTIAAMSSEERNARIEELSAKMGYQKIKITGALT
jgi:tRNA isopentenyl-2-thiomethyl-A-37 hydroxylase MiaE